MPYRLTFTSDASEDVRRCAREQLADAVDGLGGSRDRDPMTATHEARKDLKKVRSLLRLVRGCLPEDAYRAENARLREIAGALAGAREDDVLADTARALAERHPGRLPAASFDAVRARLAANAQRRRAHGGGVAADRVIADLESAAAAVDAWPLGRCGPDAVGAGAARAYRRGRAAMARAERDPSTEALHEWRKRVKDLWYQARLLEEAWPRAFKAQAKEAHALADLLGDDHDLAAFLDALAPDGPAADVALDEAALREVVALERERLRAQAWVIGRRLYAERPRDYRRRLLRYLRAAAAPPRVPA